ncbi:MAG: DUF4231 domain-containing protein [Alphaproteobacteria bacterium]|nr:MAG: DUF4231 domain-containing protein [Alphaproteobacteria bacterium]
MLTFEFPAIYKAASRLSEKSQNKYLAVICSEYVLLILVSILSLDILRSRAAVVCYLVIFIALLALLLWRGQSKPEQQWYKGRALAESVKTSSWRYCMSAEPFGLADSEIQRRAEFRNYLTEILRANQHIGEHLPAESADDAQVTETMEAVRKLQLDEKKEYYDVNRIREQRAWYARKAGFNKRISRLWIGAGAIVYIIAALVAVKNVSSYPESYWPTDPLIVIAASIIGWTQIKKFNELASSYTLTAHEIGILQAKIGDIKSADDFASFVNEAEQAFSREHTQWVARQQN